MSQRLQLLLIDDDAAHADEIEQHFSKDHDSPRLELVADLSTALKRLTQGAFDGILLKHSAASHENSLSELCVRTNMIPIIVLVTRNEIDAVADWLFCGAQEFIIEEDLTGVRLRQVVQRAIQKVGSLMALESKIEKFRASDTRMRAVLNASLDGVITLDTEGRILEFNPAAEKAFGYTSDELVGRHVNQLFRSEEKSDFLLTGLKEFQQHGESSVLGKRIEVMAIRRDGSTFVAEMAAHPVPLEEEPIFTLFIRDITVRRQAEEGQRKYAAELERSNHDLEQYASIVSHDLEAPLRAISGFCDLLQKNYSAQLDAKAKEFMALIMDGARRMGALIGDLHTYSKVATHRRPLQPIDCHAVVETSIKNLEAEITVSGAEVVVGNMPILLADKTQMIQLFQNLIGNAIKYRGKHPPKVHIVSEREEQQWVIKIRDNGIGFDPANTSQIFEIFHRLHPDESQYAGTGIGLAICKRIVEQHQGKIWAESILGEGSTFIFTFSVESGTTTPQK